jgi:hypothetical protein
VHVTPIGRIALFYLLILFTTMSFAQERHLGNEFASTLYTRSAFAHGYIHGYEDGFHSGDVDLQLGREARDPASFPSYKHACASYHSSFGSKSSFKFGFEDGFRAGYADATRGLAFRAVWELRNASNGLELTSAPHESQRFDVGFMDGYKGGRRQGADDGRNFAASNPIEPPCLGYNKEYCDAFGRGFRVGYGDGYANQSRHVQLPENLQASAEK